MCLNKPDFEMTKQDAVDINIEKIINILLVKKTLIMIP
ncbi:Uncharacterised protein [Pseudescherichia vulneris]|nr:Uncharacterised protein [Pseudescherichia vulneris]STQ60972.1 Uncharacterised protein [Pseudescherichia vulneris]